MPSTLWSYNIASPNFAKSNCSPYWRARSFAIPYLFVPDSAKTYYPLPWTTLKEILRPTGEPGALLYHIFFVPDSAKPILPAALDRAKGNSSVFRAPQKYSEPARFCILKPNYHLQIAIDNFFTSLHKKDKLGTPVTYTVQYTVQYTVLVFLNILGIRMAEVCMKQGGVSMISGSDFSIAFVSLEYTVCCLVSGPDMCKQKSDICTFASGSVFTRRIRLFFWDSVPM